MTQNDIDKKYMQRALQLAKLAGVNAAPNPMVGAVIVHNDKIIGEGFHQEHGKPHAEVNAVDSVKDMSLLSESTIYVTLEPCAHFGKTPPCADLIVQNKFKRVVVACLDTFSEVSGKGIQRMRDAGITVEIGVLESEARWLNRRFFTYHEKMRPYVILKWAETRDGFMDRLPEDRNKGINWITQPRMKMYVHKWRSEEQAIMVGWKTINNDNPQLNVRKIAGKSPHRFVIDQDGNVNLNAKVFQDGEPTTIISLKSEIKGLPDHVELITLDKISSENILSILYDKKMLSVFIEGGAQTHAHFIEDGLWDEAYQLIGSSTFENGIKAPTLSNKTLISSEHIGKDIIQHFRKS
ncbi:bifunctional diaminohydroxyphosphoribosylaminopyrimidine deaminase/5-amino-6-(5-phosphoribosylamino)uracil reductase RibD [Brumimicrobium glaciale]|uniref:Riboflavin biosynthesis protein RibD n=1 Tax=Brumimicrobium glaciale TaxID=200475 RepID=A0A4Q4KJF7_9FLAO|nr:bifunctional diaminohydroxyphosphoribosylaminopyrimidine deaminase/5-amino-6-(5-phosphoribosylamino)uracil reductase RibD [Brumimicrobium glaciale]RYM33473.1 bifunctional diaminohydroxyphosphoribosylaminopyrimidine deaminase/5-amino-6-(5-phosphoribosylamino)uracil reductase RibD [Brumimicrobium glaciale]